jgi:hypothetical protein
MAVTIKLRAIIKDKSHCLAMYDSSRRGAINNLETFAEKGSDIIWKLDDDSGILEILEISPRDMNSQIFAGKWMKTSPNEFILRLPDYLERALEAYFIKFRLDDDLKTIITIDPYIRIDPPPVRTPPTIPGQ